MSMKQAVLETLMQRILIMVIVQLLCEGFKSVGGFFTYPQFHLIKSDSRLISEAVNLR